MDNYILVGAIALMLIIGFAFTYSKGKHTPKPTQGVHTNTPAPKQPRKKKDSA